MFNYQYERRKTMCCPTANQVKTNYFTNFRPSACGCGCIGQHPTKSQLENQRDYLKATLAYVEEMLRNTEEQ
jgi:hypothetical protein